MSSSQPTVAVVAAAPAASSGAASLGASAPVRSTAALLIGVGTVFYLQWLSVIVPATIDGTTPQALIDSGLPANAVHVLDLAILLPGTLVAGALLAGGGPWDTCSPRWS